MFTEHGVPLKVYQAFRAFQGLMDTPRRVETRGTVAGKLAFAAGLGADGREATLLVSNVADPRSEVVVRWKNYAWTGGVKAEIRIVDATHDFIQARSEPVTDDSQAIRLTLQAPAVALIRLRPADGSTAKPLLAVTSPANRLVFQRDLTGNATLPLAGTCARPGARGKCQYFRPPCSSNSSSPPCCRPCVRPLQPTKSKPCSSAWDRNPPARWNA